MFDARGSFVEPHTEKRVPLGTLNVRDYLAEIRAPHGRSRPISTSGRRAIRRSARQNRFGAILFIDEKEGFTPLFEAVRLAERHDLAIMSTKGMSVTANRELVESCAPSACRSWSSTISTRSGFSIVGTLRVPPAAISSATATPAA